MWPKWSQRRVPIGRRRPKSEETDKAYPAPGANLRHIKRGLQSLRPIAPLSALVSRPGFFNTIGRVEMWRGDVRLSMSVSAPFVWRCLSGSAVAPFPHPAHRTGHADFPHPALGQDFTPSSRATPSAASEHHLELIGCPISMSFPAFCVCLELRSLPSTRVTRFPRYYEPLRHPRAPGLSLTGVRLVLSSLT
jgi:hypothetical protein